MANSTKNLVVVNWQQSVSLQDCRELANGTASDNVAAVHNALAAGVGADCRFASVRACNVLICINITMNVCVCVCVRERERERESERARERESVCVRVKKTAVLLRCVRITFEIQT